MFPRHRRSGFGCYGMLCSVAGNLTLTDVSNEHIAVILKDLCVPEVTAPPGTDCPVVGLVSQNKGALEVYLTYILFTRFIQQRVRRFLPFECCALSLSNTVEPLITDTN
jgi:hypothetical protein